MTPYTSTFVVLLVNFCSLLTLGETTDVPVMTKKGLVVGLRLDPNPATNVSYDAFLGIPYGKKPPRFQVAEPPEKWSSPLMAKSLQLPCPQVGSNFSEDCLYLNVFTPKDSSSGLGAHLPVMVYIHGGAYTHGSCAKFKPDFLVNESVLLVTMNYRLGAAGFLTLGSRVAPGNLGLHDTLMALQWVQDEISSFGGDPARVTVFGQSSGSAMTQQHYLSPLTTGLFVRAIAQSGSALAEWAHYSPDEGRLRAQRLAKAVNCSIDQSDSVLLACLQSVDINDILNNETPSQKFSDEQTANGNYLPFIPVLDTVETADKPFFGDSLENLMKRALTLNRTLLTGTNRDEGILKFVDDAWMLVESNLKAFIPNNKHTSYFSEEEKAVLAEKIHQRYFNNTPDLNKVASLVKIYTEFMFAYPSVKMSRYFSNMTYGYLFAYDGSWATLPSYFTEYRMVGVNHGAEISYLFYLSQDLNPCTNQINMQMKNYMVKCWTNFAKTGVPDKDWKTVSVGGYNYIDSKPYSIQVSDFEESFYQFWANISCANVKNCAQTIGLRHHHFLMFFVFFTITVVKVCT